MNPDDGLGVVTRLGANSAKPGETGVEARRRSRLGGGRGGVGIGRSRPNGAPSRRLRPSAEARASRPRVAAGSPTARPGPLAPAALPRLSLWTAPRPAPSTKRAATNKNSHKPERVRTDGPSLK